MMHTTNTSSSLGLEPRQVLRRIVEERAAADKGLPAEPDLARKLGLSRPALRELLAEFAADGLLSRRQGATTQINHAALHLSARFDHHEEYSAMLTRLGHDVELELLSAQLTMLGEDQAQDLNLSPEQRILCTVKRWRAGETIGMVAADYVVVPDDVTTIPSDLERTVFELIADLHDDTIEWTISHPKAELVDENTASLLEASVGSPVMVLRERGLTRSGKHLWSSQEWHHPELVDYSLVRVVI